MTPETETPSNTNQRIVLEVLDATLEGITSQCKSIFDVEWGRIAIKIAEFGMYLKNKNAHRQQFIAGLYEMYDGKVPAKIIKSEEAIDNMSNIPVNVLAYADYTVFKTEGQQQFECLLRNGFCRRFTISFHEPNNLVFAEFTDEEERNLYKKLKQSGDKLFNIFNKIRTQSCYRLLPETKVKYNKYAKFSTESSNDETNELIKTEILSRPYKALKLSGIFACLNHPVEEVIKPTDFIQSVLTVEELAKDFRTYLNFQPEFADRYEKIYEFFKQNLNKEFTKTNLIKIFCSQFGFKRELLRKNFDEVFTMLQEIANNDGHILVQETGKCKNGCYYSLQKYEEKPLSPETQELLDVINDIQNENTSEFSVDNENPF